MNRKHVVIVILSHSRQASPDRAANAHLVFYARALLACCTAYESNNDWSTIRSDEIDVVKIDGDEIDGYED